MSFIPNPENMISRVEPHICGHGLGPARRSRSWRDPWGSS